MFISEDDLHIKKEEQDLYLAHEIVLMKPLFDRDNTYNKFIGENSWVKKFLPRAISIKYQVSSVKYKRYFKTQFHYFIRVLLNFVEYVLEKLQLSYMEKKRTSEIIQKSMLRFHSIDHRQIILKKYETRMNKYQLNYRTKLVRVHSSDRTTSKI